MGIYIAIFASILLLVLAGVMIYCAFEDAKRMQDFDAHLRQLQERGQELDTALEATTKILAIQNQNLSQEETNKQIMEVLDEYESMQTRNS